PEPVEPVLADIQRPRSLGSQQPLVGAGGVKVAAEIVEIEGDLADGMGAIDVRQDAALPGQGTDLPGRQDQPGDGGDVTEGDDPGATSEGALEALDNLVCGCRRFRQGHEVELDAVPCRPLLPAAAASRVLLVGQEHLITGFQI